MTGFAIAPATEASDLAAVRRLFQAYADSLGVDLGYQDFAAELATLPGKYAAPGGALLLARMAQGEPAGCVALRPLPFDGCCEMKRLYVAPAGRGSGVGRALAEAVVAAARQRGYREIRLDTLPFMQAAMALYESLGFVEIAPYYDTPIAGTRFLALPLADAHAASWPG
ncbi:MAG: GNAT family N-acetyltransferase [Acetobacteraceae bacterium]